MLYLLQFEQKTSHLKKYEICFAKNINHSVANFIISNKYIFIKIFMQIIIVFQIYKVISNSNILSFLNTLILILSLFFNLPKIAK